MHKTACLNLQSSIFDFVGNYGEQIVGALEERARLLLIWLELLSEHASERSAPELLEAAKAAVREAAALCAIGAVRPCLFSLRAQIDLVLGWIYFKDHPVEYFLVKRTGDGFVLKKEVLKYLHDHFDGFGKKIAILEKNIARSEVDPYRLLSAHVHAQSLHVIPRIGDLKDIVADRSLVDDCLSLQRDVSEYISDILFSAGVISIDSLPSDITDSVRRRNFTPAQKSVLFS